MKNEEWRICVNKDNARKFFILRSSFFIYIGVYTTASILAACPR